MSRFSGQGSWTHFGLFSLLFWLVVVIATLLWKPVFQMMSGFMPMHAEYSLLEQTSKLVLLVMLLVSLIAYRNDTDSARQKLSIVFLLFSLAMYFSESNFIAESWQPLFGAVFILSALWLLFGTDYAAMFFILGGCGVIVMGMVGDLWADHPELFGGRSLMFDVGQGLYALEEYMDLWGEAMFAYAAILSFRSSLEEFIARNQTYFIILVLATGMVAAGNGFVHWQYGPGPILTGAATLMALSGVMLILWVHRRLEHADGPKFGLTGFYDFQRNVLLLFIVLPVIYGGVSGLMNLALWLAFFVAAGRSLYREVNVSAQSPTVSLSGGDGVYSQ